MITSKENICNLIYSSISAYVLAWRNKQVSQKKKKNSAN